MQVDSVLVVDDTEADRYLLKRLLRKAGVGEVVLEARDGQEALDLLAAPQTSEQKAALPPTLVFVDINMPGMNGFEFLAEFEKLRQNGSYASTLFVMLSSSFRDEDKKRALAFEFVRGFIEKMPPTPQSLLEALHVITGGFEP